MPLPFFAGMALSRFWTFILILSIGYVLVMLATGRQYSLGTLVNGKQGEALVVAEWDTTAWRGPLPLAEHTQQLRQEDAQARIGRLRPHGLGQLGERGARVALAQQGFGIGAGIGHGRLSESFRSRGRSRCRTAPAAAASCRSRGSS